ncbi:hypothetical protein JAAARDRAFT_192874 [Jaapia argillacea MUCL 33604]|uniref:Uncharacterized protein n=1 Tax=Jaapia argillacea MUCL 33604 TaxID=933084 RepID=A0A067Q791_9AGAM|nr:hypothetical protein JAAARDRAFT_192874 [Jaapia argillacea MUCL 33604]
MPARKIDTVINFICRIVLLLMEGIHLFIILCTYARGILIHIHTRLLQLVISTTHATYQLIAVHDIHFRIDLEGNVGYRLGHLYNEEDVLRPWQTAPTPPPPTAPLPGTPSPPTSQSHLYSPVIIKSHPRSPAQPSSAPRTASPSPPPSTAVTTPTTPLLMNPLLPLPITPDMSNLLKLINNLVLSDSPPQDTSPKSTDTSDTLFTFEPNPSATLDLPPPNSPNPFQTGDGWGDK